ncbi:MAG: hypothetical protein HWD82_07650 [Flavobacteriaceae bacterium]|nr:hypothetical protein [Flavobacteriaceae bacterium]
MITSKKKVLFILCFFAFLTTYSQLDEAIANTYIKRANKAIEETVDFTLAAEYFEKALERLDTITDKNIAILGCRIYFEIHQKQETLEKEIALLKKAESYFKQYDLLTKKKSTEEYRLHIEDLYVPILENIERVEEEIKYEKEQQRKRELYKKKIDSLESVWDNKSKSLEIELDSIFTFNKNNIALYKRGNFYGLINDIGEIISAANEYVDVLAFDGFFIFKNSENNPSKLFCYNSNTNNSFSLPNISDFFNLSTHFGKVMMPRGNGRLVTYPDNSTKAFVFELNSQKQVTIEDERELLKDLDKADVIDKFNKDGEVKKDKEWYKFGGHLGGGIHPLYAEEGYSLLAFLCAVDGKMIDAIKDYQFIGPFYDGRFEALKGSSRVWINQNGTEVSDAIDESKGYTGNTTAVKLDNGAYQLMRNGFIILGEEQLEKKEEFVNKNTSN